MRTLLSVVVALMLVAAGCGSDDAGPLSDAATSAAAGTCLAGDPNCQDLGGDAVALPLPDSIDLADPVGPIAINFGGFFYSDGETSQLCDSLAESFPPQCGTSVVEIEGELDLVLAHVAESFGNPDEARVQTEQGIWWTDEWININGLLENGKLVLVP